jgi:hypothetical protein
MGPKKPQKKLPFPDRKIPGLTNSETNTKVAPWLPLFLSLELLQSSLFQGFAKAVN